MDLRRMGNPTDTSHYNGKDNQTANETHITPPLTNLFLFSKGKVAASGRMFGAFLSLKCNLNRM
tara:strand:- start:177831 stop:178022 length:192 start_codon:yes stop_codon:yes gene_type:complete